MRGRAPGRSRRWQALRELAESLVSDGKIHVIALIVPKATKCRWWSRSPGAHRKVQAGKLVSALAAQVGGRGGQAGSRPSRRHRCKASSTTHSVRCLPTSPLRPNSRIVTAVWRRLHRRADPSQRARSPVMRRNGLALGHRGPDGQVYGARRSMNAARTDQGLRWGTGGSPLSIRLPVGPADAARCPCAFVERRVYNHRALRARFKQEGAQLSSDSDSEVLLTAVAKARSGGGAVRGDGAARHAAVGRTDPHNPPGARPLWQKAALCLSAR